MTINCLCSPNDEVGQKEHKHQCPKCGTCWKHDGEATQTSCDAFDEGHTCPSCGQENVTQKLMDAQQLDKALDALFALLGRKR